MQTPDVPKTITYTDSEGNRHENYRLTAQEYEAYGRAQGQTQQRILSEMVQSVDYAALTDDQKAKAVSLACDYAREYARGQVPAGYDGADSWMQGNDGKEAAAIVQKVASAEFTGAFDAITTAWREGYADDSQARESLESAFKVFDGLP